MRKGGTKKLNLAIGTKIAEDRGMMLDLLNILTYMSSIATANITRDKLFKLAGQQEGLSAKYFKRIHLLAKNYGYNYAAACKIVSAEVSHQALKDFLIRFANALSTGEEEAIFLRGEVERMIELYTNKYLSDVELMKKWTDGYSALLVSVVLIIAVFLIGNMIFNMGDTVFMSCLSAYLFCFVSFMGAYIIYRVCPYEKIVHSLKVKSREQELARRMCIVIFPILGITSLILVAIDAEPWLIFALVSVLLAPIGVMGMIDAKKIDTLDRDISTFLQSLGSAAGITGSTLTVAINQLDKKSVGTLEGYLEKLHKRLINQIKPATCWYHFRGETGSELINHSTTVFLDAIELGGDATKIGAVVAHSSLGISLLRAKRKLISNGFVSLVVPLHATMSGVLLFIYEIIYSFNIAMAQMMAERTDEISGASGSMPVGMGLFNISASTDLAFLAKYVTIIIFISTVANALASKFAAGGSNYKLCFYLSLLFLTSAIILFVMPIVGDKLFMLQTE
ncbi:MAG: archaellar assembly protein FlaJ [Methanomicrobia archaeon]|nr:archaellar assembly protein FlaJ [Methanomicrobia archaeon]